jgi:hypothetical protein
MHGRCPRLRRAAHFVAGEYGSETAPAGQPLFGHLLVLPRSDIHGDRIIGSVHVLGQSLGASLLEFRVGFWLEPGGYSEGGVNLGDGGPHGGGVLAVSVAEVLGGFLRELLGFAVVSSAIHRSSRCLVVCY